MTTKSNLLFALQQVENISKLLEENEYEKFFVSHLIPMKFELERQISLIDSKKSNG